MATKPETLAAMKQLIVLADKVGKVRDKVVPAFEKNEKALRAAIDAKKRHLIQTYAAVVNAHIDQITPTMSDLTRAKIALHDVNADEQFVAARVADIEKLSGRLDDAERDLTSAFQRAKRLQNDAERGLGAALKAENFELQDLAMLDRSVKELRAEAKALFPKTEAIATRASAAVEARNAKALAAAQAEMKALDIGMTRTAFELAVRRVDEMQKKAAGADLAPDLAADLLDGAKDARAELKGAEVSLEFAEKDRDRVMALAIAEIDVGKALTMLELDARFKGKLQKALDGPAAGRVKALDAIAKEAGLETDGKAMLAALVKQKVVPA
jgi:hypothetical protein